MEELPDEERETIELPSYELAGKVLTYFQDEVQTYFLDKLPHHIKRSITYHFEFPNKKMKNDQRKTFEQCLAEINDTHQLTVDNEATAMYMPWPRSGFGDTYFGALTHLDFTDAKLVVIADETFRRCDNLTSVQLPNSLECLGDEAFLNAQNSIWSVHKFENYWPRMF